MRRARLYFFCLLALPAMGIAGPVSAQPSLRVGGGISSPSGDMGDLLESGYHGRAVLQLGVPVFPVSLRAEGAVHRFDAAGTGGGSMNQLNGALSAVLSLGGLGIGPYLFAGYGKYRQDFSTEFGFGDARTNPGYHAGFGVEAGILGFGGFAEVRFVNVDVDGDALGVAIPATSLRYIPITVGIKF